MDRKWEYVSIGGGLFLLVLGLFGPLFLAPLSRQYLLIYTITLPFVLISGFLFSLGKQVLSEGWKMVLAGSVLILYGITLADMILVPGYPPVILAWGLGMALFTAMFFFLAFRLTGASFRSPAQEGKVVVRASYTRTWELCHQAIMLLPSSSILSEDEEQGTIIGQARRVTARSGIIMSLTRIDSGTTRVTVSAMSPGRLWIPELNTALNRGYVDSLCKYLLNLVSSGASSCGDTAIR